KDGERVGESLDYIPPLLNGRQDAFCRQSDARQIEGEGLIECFNARRDPGQRDCRNRRLKARRRRQVLRRSLIALIILIRRHACSPESHTLDQPTLCPPNASGEPRPIAGATQERKLLGVGSSALFGLAAPGRPATVPRTFAF